MLGGRSHTKICPGRQRKPSNRAGSPNSSDDFRSMLGGKWKKSRVATKKTIPYQLLD